nr:ABC transporter G family member 29-like [Ipomoea batatas]
MKRGSSGEKIPDLDEESDGGGGTTENMVDGGNDVDLEAVSLEQTTEKMDVYHRPNESDDLCQYFCRFFKQMLLVFLIQQMAAGIFRLTAAVCRTMIIANTSGAVSLLLVFLLGATSTTTNFYVNSSQQQQTMNLRRSWTMAEETGLGRRLHSVLGLLHQRRRRSSRRRELILPPVSLACEVDGEDLSPFLWTAQQVEISSSSP